MSTIISHKKQFVFIHINKAGGTSLSSLLEKYEEWAKIKKIYRAIERRYIPPRYKNFRLLGQHFVKGHASARMIRDTIGQERFENYFKFCIVRNPWDREVSRYFFARQTKTHWMHEMANQLDFKDFIKWRNEKAVRRNVSSYQYKKISDEQGNLIVDQIIHIEKLKEEIVPVLKKIGIDSSVAVPELNASSHKPYQSYYDSESIEIVRNFSRDDIEQLGYTFQT